MPLARQGLAASEPYRAVRGTEQSLDLLPDDGRTHFPVLVAHYRIGAVGYPQAARVVGSGYTRISNLGDNLHVFRHLYRDFHPWLGKTIEPMSRPDPDVAFAIDQQCSHSSRGQSVRVGVVIRDILDTEGGPHGRVFGMGNAPQTG